MCPRRVLLIKRKETRGKGKGISEMNKEYTRRETSNSKDTGDEGHDRKNKTVRQMYGLSEKVTEGRRGQSRQRSHNITATSWYKGVGRGPTGTHQDSFERESRRRIDVTFRGQCIRY